MADAITAALLKESGQAALPRAANPEPIRFTAEETAQNTAHDRSPESRAELTKELSRKDLAPRARAILQAEFDTNFGPNAAPVPGPVPAPQQEAANDPVTAALLGEAKAVSARSIPDSPQEVAPQKSAERSAIDEAKIMFDPRGPLETGLTLATGALGGLAGNVAGIFKGFTGGKYGTPEGAEEAAKYAQEVTRALTYQPRSEAGKEMVGSLGKLVGESKIEGLGPMAMGTVGPATTRLSAVAPKVETRAAAATAPAVRVPGQGGSVGAAGASPAQQAQALIAGASPQVQAAVAKMGDKLTPGGLKTVERYVQAESLPVPVPLTAAIATQDARLMSLEKNRRGAIPELGKRLDEIDKAMADNFPALRDRVAPDVYASKKHEFGQALIEPYQAKIDAMNAETRAAYKALKDANGGDFPLDARTFVKNADEKLHKDLMFDHVPPAIRSTMDRLSKAGTGVGGGMTFENFESLRTALARIQRSQADGNVKHAAGIIRDALEELPMHPGAPQLKELADKARGLAKRHFDLERADPAYKAVSRGKANPDDFVDKFIVRAKAKDVDAMARTLADDPVGRQAMGAGVLDYLQGRADAFREGKPFKAEQFGKSLDAMDSKLPAIYDAATIKDLQNLRDVSYYVKNQSAGSFVNNSGSTVAALAEMAAPAAEAAANVLTKGAYTPAKNFLGRYREKRELQKSMEPGAGILLKDVK